MPPLGPRLYCFMTSLYFTCTECAEMVAQVCIRAGSERCRACKRVRMEQLAVGSSVAHAW